MESSSSSSSSSSHTLNLFGVLSESKRIINSHSRHFLALSVLFLLPLSFSLIIYPTIQSLISQPNSIFNHPPHAHLFTPSTPPSATLFPILYTLFALTLFLSAFATITYSTFHAFYARPVKVAATLYSLFSSFFLLCATLIVSLLIKGVIGFLFAFLGGLVYKGFELIGLGITYNWVAGFVVFMAAFVFIYLNVIWVLAPVVVVVESKWGYEPLRRSAYLVHGMRSVALSLMVFFGLSIWFFTWACSGSVVNVGGVWGWENMVFVFQTVISSGLVTLFMLQSMAAIAVLYMYCKAVRGELAFEIAEEFVSDYISLPFDDEKVPHVVSVVYG